MTDDPEVRIHTVKPVRVVLNGEMVDGQIIIQGIQPPCDRNHTRMFVEDQNGERQLLLLLHDEEFEYI